MGDSFDHEIECCKRLINAIESNDGNVSINLSKRDGVHYANINSDCSGKSYNGSGDHSFCSAIVQIQGKLCDMAQKRLSDFNDALLFSGFKPEIKAKLTE